MAADGMMARIEHLKLDAQLSRRVDIRCLTPRGFCGRRAAHFGTIWGM